MTIPEFIRRIEAYYKPYPPAVRSEVISYLQAKWSDEDLGALYAQVTETFSTRWGTVPSKTEFKEAQAAINDDRRRTFQALAGVGRAVPGRKQLPLEAAPATAEELTPVDWQRLLHRLADRHRLEPAAAQQEVLQ